MIWKKKEEKQTNKKQYYYMEPHVSDSLKFTDDVFERIDSVGDDKFEEFVVSSLVGWISRRFGIVKDGWLTWDCCCCCCCCCWGIDECWDAVDNVSLRDTLRRYFARAFWNHTCKTRLGKFVFSARFFKSFASTKFF